jgi:hypothetical protein
MLGPSMMTTDASESLSRGKAHRRAANLRFSRNPSEWTARVTSLNSWSGCETGRVPSGAFRWENTNQDELGSVPANTVVVGTAPQVELLKRAVRYITHAGLSTTLGSLAQGVPMVALPIGYDQPGIAARIAHHRAGEFVEVENLTIEGLSRLIAKVLRDPGYRSRAHYFRRVEESARLSSEVLSRPIGNFGDRSCLVTDHAGLSCRA